MRKFILVAATALTLSACATTPTGTLDPRWANAIAAIQAGMRTACNVLPVAEDVAALLTGRPELVDQISAVVGILCNAIPPGVARRAIPGSAIQVNVFGVTVRGTRV